MAVLPGFCRFRADLCAAQTRSQASRLVGTPSARQYDCTAEAAARGKRPAGSAGVMQGVRMKTILVPTEHNASMLSALDTALLLARKFDACIEGFPLRPAVADLVAMDPDSGLTMVAVKENDAEMMRQAGEEFHAFMASHQVPE